VPDPHLAAAIRRQRQKQGRTLEALAHDIGITTGSLSKIELGQSTPAWSTVRAIADALGMTISQLAKAAERAQDE
jgi:transcriptional regulator with XRE-family HTH domain